jgi:hypothetical protein
MQKGMEEGVLNDTGREISDLLREVAVGPWGCPLVPWGQNL